LKRVSIAKNKTNSVLVVNANTVLARSIARQLFEPIARRYPQIIHVRRRSDNEQSSPRTPHYLVRDSSSTLVIEELFRLSAGK